MTKPITLSSELFVPRRIARVGAATIGGEQTMVPPDTVADPVGRRAIAEANEDVRDVPRRERVIRVGAAGETNTGVQIGASKTPSMVPTKIGDIYPGEYRHAYQLEPGDRILHLGKPTTEIGRWVLVNQVHILKVDDTMTEVEIHGITETGHPMILHMASNSQIRLVTNQED